MVTFTGSRVVQVTCFNVLKAAKTHNLMKRMISVTLPYKASAPVTLHFEVLSLNL
jgi:hypothetical protein